MSHFTVLAVLGTEVDPADAGAVEAAVEQLLAPYDENLEAEPRREYDHERILCYAVHGGFEQETTLPVPVVPEHDRNRSREEHARLWDEYHALEEAYGKAVFDKLGPTKFAKRLSGAMGEDIRYDRSTCQLYRMTTYNEASKWDWYVIGGRWSGMFRPKAGTSGHGLGNPGVFDNTPEPGCVDVIRVEDIDWEAMAREELLHRQDALALYDQEPSRAVGYFWNTDTREPDWREAYLAAPPNIATYAWVNEDGWFQKGQMGWFGAGSNEESDAVWNAKWLEAIKNLPPRTTVAVVDCHI